MRRGLAILFNHFIKRHNNRKSHKIGKTYFEVIRKSTVMQILKYAKRVGHIVSIISSKGTTIENLATWVERILKPFASQQLCKY